MNEPAALHLNLLRDNERVSSSPIRLRVMLPAAAFFACVGCVLWWMTLAGQALLVQSQIQSVETDLAARKAEHAAILSDMSTAREYRSELEQLDMYAAGNSRAWGNVFARLAEITPLKIQFTSIEIPEPAPQNLLPPNNPRAKPLLGPKETSEPVLLRLSGLTTRETPVQALLEALEGPAFTNALVIVRDAPAEEQSPRVTSFRQDTKTLNDGTRLLAFDIEYRAVERRFSK